MKHLGEVIERIGPEAFSAMTAECRSDASDRLNKRVVASFARAAGGNPKMVTLEEVRAFEALLKEFEQSAFRDGCGYGMQMGDANEN